MYMFLKNYIKNFKMMVNFDKLMEIIYFYGQNLCFFEIEVWCEF